MAGNKLVLMPVCNYFNPDNRVFRTANSLSEEGYNVIVLSYHKDGLTEEEVLGMGFLVKRIKTKVFLLPFKQLNNLFRRKLWERKVKSLAARYKPHYVHCNDYNTLFLGIYCKKKYGSKIIYDCHEYFQDLNYLHRYPMIIRRRIAAFERAAIKGYVDEMIVVSPGISRLYQGLSGKEVHIVKNVPEKLLNGNNLKVSEDIVTFLEDQQKQGRRLFLYLGTNTQRGRGLDFAFKLVSSLPQKYGLVVLGPRDNNEIMILKLKANQEGMGDRFGAFLSIPITSLKSISGFFFMGLSLIEPIYISYKHSLPNKLFEYFSMGLPVISSDIPDQGEVIIQNNLGFIIPFNIPDAIRIITESESRIFNPNIREIFKWESEKSKLIAVYQHLE